MKKLNGGNENMALVNVFYGMTILSFFTTFMFAIGGLCGSITDHPIRNRSPESA